MAEDEELLIEKLIAGDRASVCAAGMVVAHALKLRGVAVLMPDVLGRVYVLPPESIEVKQRPRLDDEKLNSLDEEEALRLLVLQGDDEDSIIEYMKRRRAARKE